MNTTWMTKKETKELKNLFLRRIIFLHQITSTFYSAERECYIAATIIKFFLISGLNVMWELLSIYAYHNSFCQVFLFCKPCAFVAGSVFVSWSIIGNNVLTMISQVSSFFFISILLLAEGRTAYMGSRADVIQYFEGSVFLKNKEMSLKRCIFIIDSFITAALDFMMIERQLHEGFSFLSSVDGQSCSAPCSKTDLTDFCTDDTLTHSHTHDEDTPSG